MRILIYENITGGGLLHVATEMLASLRPEGEAMLSALIGEFARLPGLDVHTLRDARLPPISPAANVRVHEVSYDANDSTLLPTLAASADWTILIAPELDDILFDRARLVEEAGGRLLSPSSRVVALASDKRQTTAALRRAGIPSPSSVELDFNGNLPVPLPHCTNYPAVLKRIDGAGSVEMRRIEHANVKIELKTGRWMLEEFVPGTAASAAVLCGPGGNVVLPPFTQRVDADTFAYLGGSRLVEPNQFERSRRLATKAAAILPQPVGFVGVDMVLDSDPSGKGDAVIEINPRLTTSFVGLCSIARTNLAGAMLAVAAGEFVPLEFSDDPFTFEL